MQLLLFHQGILGLNKFLEYLFKFFSRLDIWDNIATNTPSARSGVVGTSPVGGICSNTQYSIVEYMGLNTIQNNAHELGHK